MAYTTIDDPSAYFQTLLYTGNSSTRSVTFDGNSDLQPDWVWTKCRSNTSDNFVFDSTRGVYIRLFTNTTAAEVSNTNALTAFNSDGFSMGNVGGMNFNSQTYVGWGWKANGGTTASNSDGSITSTVQANTTVGFSIVTWTGSGADATIGHGLTQAPTIYIVKNRSDAADWRVGQVLGGNIMTGGNGYYMEWNDDKASTNPGSAVTWGSTPTAPTSSVFTVGSNNANNGSSDNMLAYCFHSVQGYSKFGSYTGNGDADGPFVYTGFKPAFILRKRTDSASAWLIQDNKRPGSNRAVANSLPTDQNVLRANDTTAEEFNNELDILSNGFKLTATDTFGNASGGSYIYMAFAESPFVSSEGVPTTAR